ncbi:MAG: peptidase T [Rubricoccaceae bacterium]
MTPIPADAFDLPPVARRFCRYVAVDTTADPDAASTPSTPGQLALARIVVADLRDAGVADAGLDEATGVVYATIPGHAPPDAPALPVVALCAHLDTSPDAPGAGVRPHVVPRYDGSAVPLPGDSSVVLDPARSPALADHVGHDLLCSDGTTLLGSDDKAGVAVIVQLAADLLADDLRRAVQAKGTPLPRPTLRLLFTPDEEIGRGTNGVDLERLGAGVAYTLDGSGTDCLNAETFNAAEAVVTVEGVGVHPGYAFGAMTNALRVAAHVFSALPADEAPETTRGREGFFHPHTLTGTAERATLRILLRDFEAEDLARRRALVEDAAEAARAAFPAATVRVEVRETYRNMREAIERTDPRAISVALAAARAMGFEMALEPVRGGTDGARLSERGLPTPNVFTGGHDFHSRAEWNTVQNLERALAFTHALVRAWGAPSPPRP